VADAEPARPASITQLVRELRSIEAQLAATDARATVLAARGEALDTELAEVGERAEAADAQVREARAQRRAARDEQEAAAAERAAAVRARRAAEQALADAQAAAVAAEDRLASVRDQADAARAAAERAAARLGGRRTRSAFEAWQMAAVADAVATSRRALANDEIEALGEAAAAAEEALAQARAAVDEARSRRDEAASALAEAEVRLVVARAERRPVDAELADLESVRVALGAEVGQVHDRADGLAQRRDALQQRASEAADVSRGAGVPQGTGVRGASAGAPGLATAAAVVAAGERWRETGRVVRVLDGDTFDLRTGSGIQRVRINGIQAPELSWCGGREARDALRAVLPKGTKVRLASIRASSGNAPRGVWRLKRTVHVRSGGAWQDIAPDLLERGVVFPFPLEGEVAHNDEYLSVGWRASEAGVGLYDPSHCGPSKGTGDRLHLEVVADGPGRDTAASEFVVVYNGSSRDIDLSGWMIQDTSPLNAYFFPRGAVLRADDYVVVFSSRGRRGVAPDGTRNSRFFYANTGQRWNNDVADIAFLFDDVGGDRTGNLRAWRILLPDR
jgi:uncharacterized coiled-coil DUF342 family protein